MKNKIKIIKIKIKIKMEITKQKIKMNSSNKMSKRSTRFLNLKYKKKKIYYKIKKRFNLAIKLRKSYMIKK